MIGQLVLMCPSDAFLAQLPHGKIPDRDDFRVMSPHGPGRVLGDRVFARASDWRRLFYNLISGDDPLRGVTVL